MRAILFVVLSALIASFSSPATAGFPGRFRVDVDGQVSVFQTPEEVAAEVQDADGPVIVEITRWGVFRLADRIGALDGSRGVIDGMRTDSTDIADAGMGRWRRPEVVLDYITVLDVDASGPYSVVIEIDLLETESVDVDVLADALAVDILTTLRPIDTRR